MAGVGAGACSGPWSDMEQSQFEKGVVQHGWGKWRLVEDLVPTRSNAQIKSHAQKYRKHHADECKRLEREHTARKERQRRDPPAADAAVAEAKPNRVATTTTTPLRKKGAARLGGSVSKSATNAKAPRSSLRDRRISSSLTGPIKSPSAKKRTPTKSNVTAVSSAPTATVVSSRLDFLSMTSFSAGRQGLLSPRRASATTISGIQSFPFPTRRPSAPASLTSCQGLMSPGRPLALEIDTQAQEDELAALAAAVTPSPARHDMNFDEELAIDDDDSISEALSLVGKVDGVTRAIDPLPLKLEVNDDNLDMIADFLDPSWNTLLAGADANATAPPEDDDALFPIVSASLSTEDSVVPSIVSHDSVTTVPALGEVLSSESSEMFSDVITPNVCPDPHHFLSLRSLLTSSPDFNNPKEYVLGEDGFSRMAVERGTLCRARIKTLLEEHLDMAWWRENVVCVNTAGTAVDGLALGAPAMDIDDEISSKKFALECLIALAAVMLDVDHWRAPREARMPSITAASAISTLAAAERQRFDDEDDIRHIGQLLSGLWERVLRSLGRGEFALVGMNGGNDSLAMRMKRCEAINQMVMRLDGMSRQEGNMEFSPYVSVYAHV